MVYQLLSLAGAILILGAFAAQQTKKLDADTAAYQLLNFIGGTLLCLTAIHERQYGFILLEGSWAVLSAWGLWKTLKEEG